jgi:hypothetical protein
MNQTYQLIVQHHNSSIGPIKARKDRHILVMQNHLVKPQRLNLITKFQGLNQPAKCEALVT